MRTSLLIAAGLLAAATIATSATAAPGTGLAAATAAAAPSSAVEKVHGWHRSCRPGRWGWHRHNWRWGRVPCGYRRWH